MLCYEITKKMHTADEMQELLQERWRKIISTLDEKGVQIAQKDVTIKKNDKKWVLHARMQLEESAVERVYTKVNPDTQTAEDTEEEEQAQ